MPGRVEVRAARRPRTAATAVATLLLLVLGACSEDDLEGSDRPRSSTTTVADDVTTTSGPPAPDTIVVVTTGGRLEAWAAQPDDDGTFRHQQLRLADAVADDGSTVTAGDLAGGVCPLPPSGPGRLVVAGELGGAGRAPGWVVIRIEGDRVGSLQATAVGSLRTSWASPSPRPSACAVLSDGRIVTTTVGASSGEVGELVLWFPGPDRAPVACKLDLALVDGRAALARPDPAGGEEVLVSTATGVVRFRSPLPTGATSEGGCPARDAVGVPAALVPTEPWWSPDAAGAGPATGLAPGPDGSVFVAQDRAGTIVGRDRDGAPGVDVVRPGPQEVAGPVPRLSGSPGALAVDRVGTLFYVDSALVTDPANGSTAPADGQGTLRRVRFEAGVARAPEVMGAGLVLPEGVAVLPAAGGGGGSALLVP